MILNYKRLWRSRHCEPRRSNPGFPFWIATELKLLAMTAYPPGQAVPAHLFLQKAWLTVPDIEQGKFSNQAEINIKI
jgi:hypothetical protein